nr:unnamed protein product [Digitaria exilis]
MGREPKRSGSSTRRSRRCRLERELAKRRSHAEQADLGRVAADIEEAPDCYEWEWSCKEGERRNAKSTREQSSAFEGLSRGGGRGSGRGERGRGGRGRGYWSYR